MCRVGIRRSRGRERSSCSSPRNAPPSASPYSSSYFSSSNPAAAKRGLAVENGRRWRGRARAGCARAAPARGHEPPGKPDHRRYAGRRPRGTMQIVDESPAFRLLVEETGGEIADRRDGHRPVQRPGHRARSFWCVAQSRHWRKRLRCVAQFPGRSAEESAGAEPRLRPGSRPLSRRRDSDDTRGAPSSPCPCGASRRAR